MGLKERIDKIREKKAEEFVTGMGFAEKDKETFRDIYFIAFNDGIVAFLDAEKREKATSPKIIKA